LFYRTLFELEARQVAVLHISFKQALAFQEAAEAPTGPYEYERTLSAIARANMSTAMGSMPKAVIRFVISTALPAATGNERVASRFPYSLVFWR
jgi:hypothetical protein